MIIYIFSVIIPEEEIENSNRSNILNHGRSMDSIPSTFTNGSCSPSSRFYFNKINF